MTLPYTILAKECAEIVDTIDEYTIKMRLIEHVTGKEGERSSILSCRRHLDDRKDEFVRALKLLEENGMGLDEL